MWHKNYGLINTKSLIFNYIYLNIFLSGIISSNINCAVIHKGNNYSSQHKAPYCYNDARSNCIYSANYELLINIIATINAMLYIVMIAP